MNINQWFAYLHGQPVNRENKMSQVNVERYGQIKIFFFSKSEWHKPLRKIIWKYCSGTLHGYYCNLFSAIIFFLIYSCLYLSTTKRNLFPPTIRKLLKTTCTYEKNQVRKKQKIDGKERSDVNKVAYLRPPFLLCSLHNF